MNWLNLIGFIIIAVMMIPNALYAVRGDSLFRALALSILPCAVFLFSGIMLRSIPLSIAAVVFAPCHIAISCKNTLLRQASHQ